MPMQEFLASYAVQVDEDGAGRLQAILERNRDAGAELAEVFSAARTALAGLKRELSETSGLKDLLSGLSGGSRLPNLPAGVSGLPGFTGFTGSILPSSALPAGSALLSVGADFSAADAALADFRTRLEAERPRLRVNASGISAAVSSAVASIRSMMSSLQVTVPVTAVPKVDSSKLNLTGSAGGNRGSGQTVAAFGAGGRVASPTLAMIAEDGDPEYVIPTDNEARAVPLLRGLLSELSEGARRSALSGLGADLSRTLSAGLSSGFSSALYADLSSGFSSALFESLFSGFPSGGSSDASAGFFSGADLRSSLADLSAAARSSMLPAGAAPGGIHNIQAPMTIQVTSNAAAPEAVARSIYDTAERSLLKTLQSVFA